MPAYPLMCYAKACRRAANYKIASAWSDGVTRELKTYSLACGACLPALFADARARRVLCRTSAGETHAEPAIFLLARGRRDRELLRFDTPPPPEGTPPS